MSTNPDYVPSFKTKKRTSRTTECSAALLRFEHASRRENLQTERRREDERDALNLRRLADEEEETICCNIRAFNNDHPYA